MINNLLWYKIKEDYITNSVKDPDYKTALITYISAIKPLLKQCMASASM